MAPIDDHSDMSEPVAEGTYTRSRGTTKYAREQDVIKREAERLLFNPAGWDKDGDGYVLRFDPPLDSRHQRALALILLGKMVLRQNDPQQFEKIRDDKRTDHFHALRLTAAQFEKFLPILAQHVLVIEDWNLASPNQWQATEDGEKIRYEKHFSSPLTVDGEDKVSTAFGQALIAELAHHELEHGRDFEWTPDHRGISVSLAAYREKIMPMRDRALNGPAGIA